MTPDLRSAIRAVRRRWRLRMLLRGTAFVAAGGLVAFLVAAWAVDQLRFSPAALLVFRVVAWGAVLGLAVRFLVRPLTRRITDRQVALYLEEHEPTLDGEVLSASEQTATASAAESPTLTARVLAQAMERLDAVEGGRRVERDGLRRSGGVLAGVTGLAALVVLFSPGSVRTGLPFILSPLGGNEATPYAIELAPGDSTIPRGADIRIAAAPRNFTVEEITLLVRPLGAHDWERITMTPDAERGDHGAFLFDVRDTTEYFATAGGVRSPVHRLAVLDLPYVRSITLEYRFPAYTGLDPLRQEDGGDIAALVGTEVLVEVVPTIPAAAGALVLGADTVPLDATPAGLAGTLTVARNGSYRVLLAGPDGRLVPASPDYFIDALDDQPPIVRVSEPGRDVSVTSVDELFTEVRAEDDLGLAAVELVYAVNGAAEQTVGLYGGRGNRKAVTAGHTFYLEELTLVPGDVIAYYGRARDARRGGAPAVSDIYFVTIRPFDRRWRAADAGGTQGQQGGTSPGELSARQRDIIAATFRLVRDRVRYSDREWRDNLSTVTLMQGRLREEVETLVRRIESRGVVELDSTMATVAEALPLAAAAMGEAEERLGRREPEPALSPEQRALQHLQRAEAAFRERQLARGEPGQGGGGAPDASAEELAELFELELDRMRNQYERVERGERQETDQQVDEALEKLRELARRQQQENERRRVQAQNQARGGAGAGGQRRLAEEADSLARRLERLSRERQNPELAETARRLQDAADAMRRAAADREGAAQGESALDRLREARRRLEGARSAGLEQDLRDALRRAERLAEQQREVQDDVRRLGDGGGRAERLRRLSDRKEQMAAEVDRLESDLDRLSREARTEQPEAAERLRQAVREARDGRLQDKIRYSRGVMEQRSREYAERFEEEIRADLEELRDGIAEAASRMGASETRELERALEQTRDAARALESLGERARENAATGDSGAGGDAGRQLRRELRERIGQLRELRQQLQRQGVDVGPLDRMLRQLGRLDNQGGLGTPQGLDQLQQAIVQGLKDYEFSLRRQLLGEDPRPTALDAGEAVPPEYRAMVEEYYRRLAERRR